MGGRVWGRMKGKLLMSKFTKGLGDQWKGFICMVDMMGLFKSWVCCQQINLWFSRVCSECPFLGGLSNITLKEAYLKWWVSFHPPVFLMFHESGYWIERKTPEPQMKKRFLLFRWNLKRSPYSITRTRPLFPKRLKWYNNTPLKKRTATATAPEFFVQPAGFFGSAFVGTPGDVQWSKIMSPLMTWSKPEVIRRCQTGPILSESPCGSLFSLQWMSSDFFFVWKKLGSVFFVGGEGEENFGGPGLNKNGRKQILEKVMFFFWMALAIYSLHYQISGERVEPKFISNTCSWGSKKQHDLNLKMMMTMTAKFIWSPCSSSGENPTKSRFFSHQFRDGNCCW